jgi:hypothetical protein
MPDQAARVTAVAMGQGSERGGVCPSLKHTRVDKACPPHAHKGCLVGCARTYSSRNCWNSSCEIPPTSSTTFRCARREKDAVGERRRAHSTTQEQQGMCRRLTSTHAASDEHSHPAQTHHLANHSLWHRHITWPTTVYGDKMWCKARRGHTRATRLPQPTPPLKCVSCGCCAPNHWPHTTVAISHEHTHTHTYTRLRTRRSWRCRTAIACTSVRHVCAVGHWLQVTFTHTSQPQGPDDRK